MLEHLGSKLPGGLQMEVGFEAGIPEQLRNFGPVKVLWSIVEIFTRLVILLATGSLWFTFLVVDTLCLYRCLELLLTGAAAPERASYYDSVFQIIVSVVRLFILPPELFVLDVLFFAAHSWIYGWQWSDAAEAKVGAVLRAAGGIVVASAYVVVMCGLWHEAAHLVCNALVIWMVASRFLKVDFSVGSALFTWIVAFRLVEVLLIFAADALKLACAMWMSFWQRYRGAELLLIPCSSVVMSYRTVYIATSGDPLKFRPCIDVTGGLERALSCTRNSITFKIWPKL